jgi:predicted nucleic acid binding AN1-type Zn finger protein
MSSNPFPGKLNAQDAEAVAKAKNMTVGDVEQIGAHCHHEYCHIKTFLPFTCQFCKYKFCEDHWRPEWHSCAAAAKAEQEKQIEASKPKKPSLFDHEKQCYSTKCKTLIDTPAQPSVHCDSCRRDYCLKHRMKEDHDCDNVPRRPPPGQTALEAQKEKGLSALTKFKSWASKKKEETKASAATVSIRPKPRIAPGVAAVNKLKVEAKGDAKVPQEKRVYLFVEASADTTTAKFPTGKFYYSKDWSIGRVLDAAAKALQVQNVNNRVPGEEERLRVFHVEAGRLLEFSEKVGDVLATGNTIVLLRGVGPAVPDLIQA